MDVCKAANLWVLEILWALQPCSLRITTRTHRTMWRLCTGVVGAMRMMRTHRVGKKSRRTAEPKMCWGRGRTVRGSPAALKLSTAESTTHLLSPLSTMPLFLEDCCGVGRSEEPGTRWEEEPARREPPAGLLPPTERTTSFFNPLFQLRSPWNAFWKARVEADLSPILGEPTVCVYGTLIWRCSWNPTAVAF